VGIRGADARAIDPISAVFLQSALHLLESHTGSRHSGVLQRAAGAYTAADQFIQGVYAAAGEQRA